MVSGTTRLPSTFNGRGQEAQGWWGENHAEIRKHGRRDDAIVGHRARDRCVVEEGTPRQPDRHGDPAQAEAERRRPGSQGQAFLLVVVDRSTGLRRRHRRRRRRPERRRLGIVGSSASGDGSTGPVLASASTSPDGKTIDGSSASGASSSSSTTTRTFRCSWTDEQRTVPAFIGIAPDGSCLYWLHSHTPDGVIHMESPVSRTFTLGNYFDIWGQPLSATQVGPAKGTVTAFVDGKKFTGDPARHPARRAHERTARRRQGRAVQELQATAKVSRPPTTEIEVEHARRGERLVGDLHAEQRERVGDRVEDRGRRADRAALAHALVAAGRRATASRRGRTRSSAPRSRSAAGSP